MRFNLTAYFIILISFLPEYILAQCCAGGSGSPIAGGTSQGVLVERQFEINTNFQFVSTDKFYKQDSRDTNRTFDSFSSQYMYMRLAYGVTKNLTMSVEGGYFFKKEETGLNENPATTYNSSGFSDLILFPRYDVINRTTEKVRTEVTVGLGYKIPIGSYNDSVGNVEPFSGNTYYITKPQNVQLSSGGQDIIFYMFLFKGFTEKNFRIYANGLYILKGWNPNGEKLGDFASVSLNAGKSFLKNFGVSLQARYEWVDKMKMNEYTYLYGKPTTYYPEATGYKKVFITPQLSFSKGKFTFYGLYDFPVYQYLNTSEYYTQAGSQFQATLGVSYRFFVKHSVINTPTGSGNYFCPMHPEIVSDKPGICPDCKMDLEKRK